MKQSLRLLVPALAATVIALPAAAQPRPAAEIIFKGVAPEAVAPALASECTRRRMALIRNTPERVVCKRPLATAKARTPHTVSELWSFGLDRISRGRTKVEARASFEAAAPHGYALLSFREPMPESSVAMRGFMENVRDGAAPELLGR